MSKVLGCLLFVIFSLIVWFAFIYGVVILIAACKS